jgi:hypothetical protein
MSICPYDVPVKLSVVTSLGCALGEIRNSEKSVPKYIFYVVTI